ncbi:uncharacterized protein [Epargyreus clarus]|uniref:uncharacterized protein n=1 Tax=Epargyreus clarus TaxID=520877 RepID=UPI003C2FEFBA
MSQKLCGVHVGSVGVLAVFLYLIDVSIASLDGYIPGQDYPAFEEVPQGLSFTCDDKIPGYYADPETRCQVWHWCVPSIGGNLIYSFICAPGTVFNQQNRVCDWFFKVDCQSAPAYYAINEDLYKDEAGNYIAGKKLNNTNTDIHENRRMTARRKRQERTHTRTRADEPTNRRTRKTT